MSEPTKFHKLIEITKQLEAIEAAGGTISDHPELLIDLANNSMSAFKQARSGDGLYLIQGRKFGDDDDTVNVSFSPSLEAAQTAFVTQTLGLEEEDDTLEDREPNYFIIDAGAVEHFLPEPSMEMPDERSTGNTSGNPSPASPDHG